MSRVRSRNASDGGEQHDIGTLWTLKRGESAARCALMAVPDGLEVRVIMDGSVLRWERCDRHEQAFTLAERWCTRMMDRGWKRPSPASVRLGRRDAAV